MASKPIAYRIECDLCDKFEEGPPPFAGWHTVHLGQPRYSDMHLCSGCKVTALPVLHKAKWILEKRDPCKQCGREYGE